MTGNDDIAKLHALARRIAADLEALSPEGDEGGRYAYRLATACALSLADQLEELESYESGRPSSARWQIASLKTRASPRQPLAPPPGVRPRSPQPSWDAVAALLWPAT